MIISRLFFTLSIIFLPSLLWAQDSPQVGEMQESTVSRFESDSARENTFLFPMGFGKAELSRTPELPERPIQQISIIYTDYPEGRDFSKLNQRRVAALLKAYPALREVPADKWKLIKQISLASEEEARSRFHGIMVQWEPASKPVTERVKRRMKKIEEEYVEKGNFKDSIVFRVLERHRDEWKNHLAVCDWTGSVYPYSSQVLHWHKLNSDSEMISAFTFFNDGDDTPDADKKIGQTGGIYIVGSENLDDILAKMLETMTGGIGGDGPENDIEAVLTGLEVYQDVEAVILIADNNSSVRDIELYTQIKKPLRIILCGIDKTEVVNPVYVNLARYTNGSLHTIEEDIDYLQKLGVGDTVKIQGNSFYLSDDDFLKLIED